MNQAAFANRLAHTRFSRTKDVDPYYSAEFSINGLDLSYQFRIRKSNSKAMCVAVKENSDILSQLSPGDTLQVKYHANDSCYPPKYLKTAIVHITRHDQGPFKGHCLVGLQILDHQK